jgi:hypothetical protein
MLSADHICKPELQIQRNDETSPSFNYVGFLRWFLFGKSRHLTLITNIFVT